VGEKTQRNLKLQGHGHCIEEIIITNFYWSGEWLSCSNKHIK